MRVLRNARAWHVALFLLTPAGFSCGSVGEPLPPLLNIPGRVEDFRAFQQADRIVARWSRPRLTTEGEALKDLERFTVRLMELTAAAPVPSSELFDERSRPAATLEGDELPAVGSGEAIEIVLSAGLYEGKRIALGVRGVSAKGRESAYSDFVVLEIIAPPGPPPPPALLVEAEGVRVEWAAVEGAVAYRVERRGEGETRFAEISRGAETAMLDRAVEWGASYSYRLRAEVAAPSGPVVSDPSAEASVTPRDEFPPEAPRGLAAVVSSDGVELSWSANREPDLAGYRVYRDGEPLHDSLRERASFSDSSVEAGASYRYTVAAEDRAGNLGPASEPIEARVP